MKMSDASAALIIQNNCDHINSSYMSPEENETKVDINNDITISSMDVKSTDIAERNCKPAGKENCKQSLENMDIRSQEDAVDDFLAGESKNDFSDELLLTNMDNDDEGIDFKTDNVIIECSDTERDILEECEINNYENIKSEKHTILHFKRSPQVTLAQSLKKRSIKCLNKMHAIEDVHEGSEVPSIQPSSPGHADVQPVISSSNTASNSCSLTLNKNENDVPNNTDSNEAFHNDSTNRNESINTNKECETNDEEVKTSNMEFSEIDGIPDNKSNCKDISDKEFEPEVVINSLNEDTASNDSTTINTQNTKRKLNTEDTPAKKLRTQIHQNFILRDNILNEYMESIGCQSIDQIQAHTEQILAEIRTLNELAREKEREWNNIIHLKKVKEELLLRMQRKRQILLLNNDKLDYNDLEISCESQIFPVNERLQTNNELRSHSVLKHNSISTNGGLTISLQRSDVKIPTGSSQEKILLNRQRSSMSKLLQNNSFEGSDQSSEYRLSKHRPVLDVQSIIADYRQRHPETVPRRGRRIRSMQHHKDNSVLSHKSSSCGILNFSSVALGSGSQVKQNFASGVDINNEINLLLNAMDNSRQDTSRSGNAESSSSQMQLDGTSFKDVLVEFAKLSQNERQNLMQNADKHPPPPYPEVTVHPVPTSSETHSHSLLHGILTKSQTKADSKTTFSPTLARLLTAPEKAPSNTSHTTTPTTVLQTSNVSISDILCTNKARNEITITPVGGQYDLSVKDKTNNQMDEDEVEDSTDRLVIDESGEAVDVHNRTDNNSDASDEVPQCQGCNQKPAQFVCAGCGNQWYCSRDCQVSAWDEHSEVCSG